METIYKIAKEFSIKINKIKLFFNFINFLKNFNEEDFKNLIFFFLDFIYIN